MWFLDVVTLTLSILTQTLEPYSRALDDPSSSTSVAHLDIPVKQPLYAERVDPQLVAFSIEADRWPDWAGHEVGKPNEYARQLFGNLQDRTGLPPAIRVGGRPSKLDRAELTSADSEDRTHVDLSLPVGHAKYPPRTPHFPYPEAEKISVGRDWYALSANLAPKTPFTWGLNLKSLDLEETVQQAKLLSATFSHDDNLVLDAIEIGNEPEYYHKPDSGGGVKNPGDFTAWSPRNFTQTWTQFAKAVLGEFAKDDAPRLRIGEVQSAGLAEGWAPQSLFQAGLLDDPFVRDHLGVYSEHVYQTTYLVGRNIHSGELMDKFNTRGNLSRRVSDVETCRRANLTFVLVRRPSFASPELMIQGETSTSSNHGTPGLSDVAEAALWVIDFALQSASLGISRVYLSHGVGYRYSSFQPVSGITDDGRGIDRPHIMPMYYGLLVVNEAIGSSQSDRYVAELGCLHRNIVAYGIYEDGHLARLILINTQVVHAAAAKERASIEVSLDFTSSFAAAYSIKRLRVPHTQAYHNLTWNGQDFDTSSGTPDGEADAETHRTSTVIIDSSSAVLLTFET